VRPARRPPHAPTFHAGIDISIPGHRPGEVPVYSVADALVERLPLHTTRRGPFDGYGNAVVLKHIGSADAGFWTFYCHLDHHAPYMQQFLGTQRVLPAGSVVGFVGNTTNDKFPGMHWHLHFEVRHATRAGASPLPGPYQVYNDDPQAWLAQRGITFSGANIVVDGQRACVPVYALSDALVRQALLVGGNA